MPLKAEVLALLSAEIKAPDERQRWGALPVARTPISVLMESTLGVRGLQCCPELSVHSSMAHK